MAGVSTPRTSVHIRRELRHSEANRSCGLARRKGRRQICKFAAGASRLGAKSRQTDQKDKGKALHYEGHDATRNDTHSLWRATYAAELHEGLEYIRIICLAFQHRPSGMRLIEVLPAAKTDPRTRPRAGARSGMIPNRLSILHGPRACGARGPTGRACLVYRGVAVRPAS